MIASKRRVHRIFSYNIDVLATYGFKYVKNSIYVFMQDANLSLLGIQPRIALGQSSHCCIVFSGHGCAQRNKLDINV